MKSILVLIISLIGLTYGANLSFSDIPIQEEGRIKPLDTFADNQLLRIYGKSSLSNSSLSSTDWLFGILTDDSLTLSLPVFYIRNPEVVNALELDMNDDRRYKFEDISLSIESKIDMLEKINQKPEDNRTLVEQQLLEIYFNALNFKMLQSDLLCLTPILPIKDANIADRLGVKIDDKVSFFKFIRNLEKMQDFIDAIESKNIEEWSSSDISFYEIITILPNLSNNLSLTESYSLRILPPFDNNHGSDWMSPWQSIGTGNLRSSYHDDILISLEHYIQSQYNEDEKGRKDALKSYEQALYNSSDGIEIPSVSMLKRETWYNHANLFTISIVFYIFGFIMICFSLLFWNKWLRRVALLSVVIGFGFHFYGILLRMIIMGRPPVSTLYESIIFVGLISILCAFLIEYSRRDGLGVLAASIAGSIFMYISFGYASDGDTMGVLVAVLNSNFWLATHVTTITIGYGTSIVAGIMGHIYLFYSILYPNRKKRLRSIYNNTFGITILALFFTLFGTILGGIWADQSWGRFWGWDPKENGALLICMWQIFMIHLRLTGIVKGLGFAAGMVINNIIVALAWFGVNLLSIGLHSYGFASGIAMNLLIFCSIELFISLGGYLIGKIRQFR